MSDYLLGDPPDDRGLIVGIPKDDLDALHARIRELEDALREKAQGVKLRPLEWVPDGSIMQEIVGPGWHAQTAFGEYFIFQGDEDDLFRWGNLVTLHETESQERDELDTLEAAKAAAQADYERRIRSALTPAPVSMEEAARVLLDDFESDKPETNWPAVWEAMRADILENDSVAAFAEGLRALAGGE